MISQATLNQLQELGEGAYPFRYVTRLQKVITRRRGHPPVRGDNNEQGANWGLYRD
jgi:hypothetical protein